MKLDGHTAATYLRVDDTLGDILEHSAFVGFGTLLLPWDNRRIDTAMPLRKIATLLPYHTHVDPAVAVSSINRMIDDASAGRTVFYDFYTVAEKEAEPSRRTTGLFFFRGRPDAPFAVIAPGGAFAYVASVHEGFPYAVEISKCGYHAFVLGYRARRGGRSATEDLAAALTFILRNAGGLRVAADDYSLWGSSAGGARMAASIGSHGTAQFDAATLPPPATVVLLYSGHSDLGPSEPPTFVAVGENDRIAPALMKRRIVALQNAGTDVAFHEYPAVGHGFGLGIDTSAEGWIGDAVRFWAKHINDRAASSDRETS